MKFERYKFSKADLPEDIKEEIWNSVNGTFQEKLLTGEEKWSLFQLNKGHTKQNKFIDKINNRLDKYLCFDCEWFVSVGYCFLNDEKLPVLSLIVHKWCNEKDDQNFVWR